jgi:putative ABC transport system permease protein
MRYILNSKIGFDKDQVVIINGANALGNQTRSFSDEIRKLSFVKNVSVSDFLPVAGTKRNGNTFWQEGKLNSGPGIIGQHWVVDENYISTLGMKLAAGRNFSKEMPTDSQACIINTAMAEQLEYHEPVGKKITNGQNLTIIGVVDNFYFESVKQKVAPLCLVLGSSNSMMSIKVNGSGMKEAMPSIMATWKKFMPHQPLRYGFLDESYAAMYDDVKRMQEIFTGFSLLAIVVACLGLFALSAFMAEQRQKEIGIRKVLGASAYSLSGLLAKDFLKLVSIAIVIAAPLAYYFMQKWLEDFAYRVNINWQVFVFAGAAALIIAALTVSFQAIKAAVANPVKSLRTE